MATASTAKPKKGTQDAKDEWEDESNQSSKRKDVMVKVEPGLTDASGSTKDATNTISTPSVSAGSGAENASGDSKENTNEVDPSETESENERRDSENETNESEKEQRNEQAGPWVVTMALSGKLPTIDLEADDLAAQLKLFKYRHAKLMNVNNIPESDTKRRANSFIAELPAEAVQLLMDYDWDANNKDEDKIDDVIAVLLEITKKKGSRLVARHKLLTRFMKKGEKFSDFKKVIFNLAEQCGYTKEVKEDLLRDIIISRHVDEKLQQELLYDLEDTATLDKVVGLCERHEETRESVKEFRPSTSQQHVNAATGKETKDRKEKKDKAKDGEKSNLWRCDRFCGGYHMRGSRNCKAFGQTCTKCGKPNHFEEVCRNMPLPGWTPKNEASKANHKRVMEQRANTVRDHASDNEIQRSGDGRRSSSKAYDSDLDNVRADTSSDSEGERKTAKRPARRVSVTREKITITARQRNDLRNRLEEKETSKEERHSKERERRHKSKSPEERGRRRERDQDRRRRRSPSPEPKRKRLQSEVRKPKRSEVKKETQEHKKPEPEEKKKKNDDELDFEPPTDEDVDLVSEKMRQPRLWDENVAINGRVHKMKVDSGSTVNTMSIKSFQRLQLDEGLLQPSLASIRTYSSTTMHPIGEFTVTLTLRGRKTKAVFLLLDEDVPSLLGLPSGAALGLFRMTSMSLLQYAQDDEYNFDGIDAMHDEFLQPCQKTVTLKMKENANPVVIPARKVPLALREEVFNELQRMQRLGVISPVDEPRPWCHAMVVARKPNGKLRICIDPRTLNPHLEREQMMIPDIDSIIMDLNEAKVLTVIDLEAGFWQVGVDDDSAKLLTFATPWGRFQYNRLPFGISIAPEIFHKAVADALQGIPGVVVFVDDILIYAPTKEEHDRRLKEVKARLEKAHFTENKTKSGQVAQEEVKFLGHIVGNGQIRPDPTKIAALLDFPEPKCRKELKGLEGMLGWLRKFLPQLSDFLNDFRHLQKEHTAWVWTASERETFAKIKAALKEIQPLMAIKPGEPFFLSADASAYGLGAALTQRDVEGNDRPIFFASRLLNDHEMKYAQVDKELLAVAWALERLDTFVYGQKITVRTDHKPLLGLVKKPMVHMSPRQQRLVARLMRYDFDLLYVPGRELIAADFLSRTVTKPGEECRCKMMGTDINLDEAFVSMLANVELGKDLVSVCERAAKNDESYAAVKVAYANDWPSGSKPLVGEYWSNRDELTVENDFVFFRGRLVVPRAARNEVLRFLHAGHVGMTAMMKRAETTAWWPGMKNDVKRTVEKCGECQGERPAQRREPMLSFDVPTTPGIVVHGDYLEFGTNEYVILVDGFSGWTELHAMRNRRPSELMRVMRLYMIRNGVPQLFHADQGSAFEAREFQEFCEKWGIKFSDNSPKYPRGNGIAEAHVKKAKHILATAADDDELAMALLAMMQTPVAMGSPSPAQLHMGRNMRDALHPQVNKEERGWEEHRRWKEAKAAKAKEYYDRGTRELSELQPSDQVLVWHKEQWQRGEVVRKLARPRSYEVKIHDTGRHLERNRAQIRAVAQDLTERALKRSQPFSLLQQRIPLPVLTAPTGVRTGAASTSGSNLHDQTYRSEEDDQPENENDTSSEPPGDSDVDVSESESEYEDVEESEASQSTDGEDTPPRTPSPAYRTKAGRPVRQPNRYSPS